MAHHVVEYFLENYLIEKLIFDVKLGRKTLEKQQLCINVCGYLRQPHNIVSSKNLIKKDADNKHSDRKRNIYFAEKIIKQMSGNLYVEESENSLNCTLSFWVNIKAN